MIKKKNNPTPIERMTIIKSAIYNGTVDQDMVVFSRKWFD